jgi:nucleoside-diphosphate-sugar epimerase
MISVFGSTGFIGGRFSDLYSEESIRMPRESRDPQSKDVLYLISTIDNYNVFTDPFLDIKTNLTLLIETLEKCKDKKDIVFNFISSWFVYGKTDSFPATEESACNPKGFYSITKRAAEQLLISYCETFGIKYRIFRLCNVYGETDGKVSKKRNALQFLIGELAEDRDIKLYDNGENIRDFMYVDDVCRAIHLCIRDAPKNDIYNIGSGAPHRFKDIMKYAKEKLGSKADLIPIEPPAFHKVAQVKDMYLDTTKLKNLGFVEKFGIEKGLDRIVENIKEIKNE